MRSLFKFDTVLTPDISTQYYNRSDVNKRRSGPSERAPTHNEQPFVPGCLCLIALLIYLVRVDSESFLFFFFHHNFEVVFCNQNGSTFTVKSQRGFYLTPFSAFLFSASYLYKRTAKLQSLKPVSSNISVLWCLCLKDASVKMSGHFSRKKKTLPNRKKKTNRPRYLDKE